MEKEELLLIHGTEYKEMTREILYAAGLEAQIGARDKKIGIKPNLVAPSEAFLGATTHPEIVAGIIEYLQEAGFQNIIMLEGSWVGDKTRESMKVCGYEKLSEMYKVPFKDMQADPGELTECGGMELEICREAKSLDFLINVPVMKGHCQTKITCALKNMKGLLPNREKRHFHAMGLHKPIAHLAVGLHQDFILVDNICGDWDFEDGGNPVEMNRLIAGRDPVLVDAFVCHEMGVWGGRSAVYPNGRSTGGRMCRLDTGPDPGTESTGFTGGKDRKEKSSGSSGCRRGGGVLQCLLRVSDPCTRPVKRRRRSGKTGYKDMYRTGISGKDRNAWNRQLHQGVCFLSAGMSAY